VPNSSIKESENKQKKIEELKMHGSLG